MDDFGIGVLFVAVVACTVFDDPGYRIVSAFTSTWCKLLHWLVTSQYEKHENSFKTIVYKLQLQNLGKKLE